MHCPKNPNRYRLPLIGVDLPLQRLYLDTDGSFPPVTSAQVTAVSDLPHMRWLNPGDPVEKRLSLLAATRLASYLMEDPDHERGAIITTDDCVLPFLNGAKQQLQPGLVRLDDNRDFTRLIDLTVAGKVWGWGHSHVNCAPTPSGIDIAYHRFSFNMVIFSCSDLTFGIYTAKEIETLANA
jgi:hypothetical protein